MSDLPKRRHARLPAKVYEGPGTAGHYTCCTRDRREVFWDPDAAQVIVDGLRGIHGQRWRILGYCVMPDHVHILALSRGPSLIEMIRLLKGRAATSLRSMGLRDVWQKGYFDHLVRKNESIIGILRYLIENPVRAGLVDDWAAHPWSGSMQWPAFDSEMLAQAGDRVLWSQALADTDEANG